MDTNPYESPQADADGTQRPAPVPAAIPGGYKDRSVGLTVFGVLEILIGGVTALMIPFMALSVAMSPAGGGAGNVRMMIPGMVMYGLAAVVFVWLDVGSILARRWARALMLVLSSMWLVVGVLAMVCYVPLMSGMFSKMAGQGQIPPGAMVFMMVISGGTIGCLYVILPGAFVLFYRSKHVKATCEVRDPHVRWTDRCPLPVLAVCLLQAFAALQMISTPAFACVLPFFGFLLRGFPAAVVFLVNAVLLGWLALATYRLRMHAWWATVAFYVFWGLSTVITFSRVSMIEFYRGMDFPQEQLKMLQQMAGPMNLMMTWGMAVFLAVLLGYLVYVRKYFLGRS